MRGHASCNSLLFYSGMILLGTELEDKNLLTFAPDSGFNGLVSHVYVWNRALDPLTEITLMADDRDNLVQTDSLIVDWAYYVTERGVSVLRPSTAGDSVCPEGFGGLQCSVRLPGETAQQERRFCRTCYVYVLEREALFV